MRAACYLGWGWWVVGYIFSCLRLAASLPLCPSLRQQHERCGTECGTESPPAHLRPWWVRQRPPTRYHSLLATGAPVPDGGLQLFSGLDSLLSSLGAARVRREGGERKVTASPAVRRSDRLLARSWGVRSTVSPWDCSTTTPRTRGGAARLTSTRRRWGTVGGTFVTSIYFLGKFCSGFWQRNKIKVKKKDLKNGNFNLR